MKYLKIAGLVLLVLMCLSVLMDLSGLLDVRGYLEGLQEPTGSIERPAPEEQEPGADVPGNDGGENPGDVPGEEPVKNYYDISGCNSEYAESYSGSYDFTLKRTCADCGAVHHGYDQVPSECQNCGSPLFAEKHYYETEMDAGLFSQNEDPITYSYTFSCSDCGAVYHSYSRYISIDCCNCTMPVYFYCPSGSDDPSMDDSGETETWNDGSYYQIKETDGTSAEHFTTDPEASGVSDYSMTTPSAEYAHKSVCGMCDTAHYHDVEYMPDLHESGSCCLSCSEPVTRQY